MTAIGTTTPTAILSCLFRPRYTGLEKDADELLKVVGDGNEDDEEGDGIKGSAGDVTVDTEVPLETFDD